MLKSLAIAISIIVQPQRCYCSAGFPLLDKSSDAHATISCTKLPVSLAQRNPVLSNDRFIRRAGRPRHEWISEI